MTHTNEELPSGLSNFLAAIERDNIALTAPAAPQVQSGSWSSLHFGKEDAAKVSWAADGYASLTFARLRSEEQLAPVEVKFEDHSMLRADEACVVSIGSAGVETKIANWRWQSDTSARYWAAEVAGIERFPPNMTIKYGRGFSRKHCRIEANYDLHVVATKSRRVLVVDTRDSELNFKTLCNDLLAMELSLGPFEVTRLLGFNERHEIAEIIGIGPNSRDPSRGNKRCPVAMERDLYIDSPDDSRRFEYYEPVLARAVASQLEKEDIDSPLYMAIDAYLDSLSGRVHSSYLLVQVALEALCAKILPKQPSRVKDAEAWREYVDSQEDAIRKHMRDEVPPEDVDGFIGSLRHGATQSPSTKTVLRAFEFMVREVPEEALKEVKLRNAVAHRFSMVKNSEFRPQREADRLATIQTLLVAAIAHWVGYHGPIVDWTWKSEGRGVPKWWPYKHDDLAKRRYTAQSSPPHEATDSALHSP